MKQLRIILLVLLFLQSKIGMAFNVHYCGSQIAKISWSFDAKGCGMENPKTNSIPLAQLLQQMCCSDDQIIAQNDTDQNTTQDDLVINPNATAHSSLFGQSLVLPNKSIIQRTPDPPPVISALYKRNCALVFYE